MPDDRITRDTASIVRAVAAEHGPTALIIHYGAETIVVDPRRPWAGFLPDVARAKTLLDEILLAKMVQHAVSARERPRDANG